MKLVSKIPELMVVFAETSGKPCNNTTIANGTGLTATTVGRYVRGQCSQLDIDTIIKLAQFFGASSLGDLFDFEVPKPVPPTDRPETP